MQSFAKSSVQDQRESVLFFSPGVSSSRFFLSFLVSSPFLPLDAVSSARLTLASLLHRVLGGGCGHLPEHCGGLCARLL